MSEPRGVRISAKLVVEGFTCQPDELNQILGVRADSTWEVGDLVHPRLGHRHRQRGWMLVSRLDRTLADATAHVLDILSRCGDPAAFARLPPGSETTCLLGITGYDERPVCRLGSDALSGLGRIGAVLDVDPYDLSRSVDEASASAAAP